MTKPCSKRSLSEWNNSIVEKQTTSTSTLVNQLSPDYQGSQSNLDHFTLVYENNLNSDDSDTSIDESDSQPEENDEMTENPTPIQKQTTKIHDQTTIDAFITEYRCTKETNLEQLLAKDIACEIVRLMREMKVNEEGEVDSSTAHVHIYPIVADLSQWKQIGNIFALVEKISCIEFFYDQEMEESVIRCNVCFASISKKDKSLKDLSPYRAARKISVTDHENLSTGI